MMIGDCTAGDLVVVDEHGTWTFVRVGALLGARLPSKRKKAILPWCVLVNDVDHQSLMEIVGPGRWRAMDPDLDVVDVVEPYAYRFRVRFGRRGIVTDAETDPMMNRRETKFGLVVS